MTGLEAGDGDKAVAVAGVAAVVGADSGTVFVGHMEHRAGQRGLVRALLQDGEGIIPLVPEGETLHLAVLNENLLGGAVQHEPLHRLDLPCDDSGSRLHIGQHDLSGLVGIIDPVVGAYRRATAVDDLEGDAGQGFIVRALDVLSDDEGSAGGIVKMERLDVVGVDYHRLGLLRRINGVPRDGLDLSDHQRTHNAVDGDFPIPVRHIDAVAADLSVFIGDKLPGGSSHLKGNAGQRLVGDRIPFVDDQRTRLGVGHHHSLGVPIGPNDHIGAGRIHDIACRSLDFRKYIGAGREIGDPDFALGIGSKNAVLGKRTGANHTVQTHFATGRCGDAELRPGERLVGGAVPFLDNELALGLVFHGYADRLASLDHHSLGLGINEESRRRLGFRDDHALSGRQALDAHLAIFVRTVNAVVIPNEAAVRVGHLELRVRQRYTGVDTAHLPNEERAGGLVAELQGLGLVGLDLDRLGHIV